MPARDRALVLARPRRRARRSLVALVTVAFLAAFAGNGAALAQTSGDTTGGASPFGGYKLEAHGEGVTFTYDSPGLIPGTPSPLFALSLPESLSNTDSGPSSYALSSVVYPGPLVADLPSVLALGGVPQASAIPNYPVRAQAFYPAGPTSADEQVGTGRQSVDTGDGMATATTNYGALELPGILRIGQITSMVDTHLEATTGISRTHVELSGVDLLAGLVHIESVVTDIVATTDAKTAATAGTTTVSGLQFLGLPATLDATGLHLAPSPAQPPPPTTAGPLASLIGPLQPIADALSQLMVSALGTANADLNQLLAQAGIEMKLLSPSEVVHGADGSRLASGLLVTLTYNGSTEPVLSDLLNLIPIESLPSQGLGPIPFSSPQALVLALKATHVLSVGMGAGSVRAAAAPPFTLPAFPGTLPGSGGFAGSPTGTLAAGFTTPAPSLAGTGGGGATVADALPVRFAGAAPLAGAVVALLVVLAGAMAAFGGGRIADNVLAAAGSSCPEGLDRVPAPGGGP